MRRLLVLRPEPGNRATVQRAREIGLDPVPCPLFNIHAVEWSAPDPHTFDAVLFTSANALRHGGEALATLTALPALAVGPATADAARASRFSITMTGRAGVDELLAALPKAQRLLHLAGAEHHPLVTRHIVETVVVYRAVALGAPLIPSGELVALVHSPRAGERFAALAPDRARVSIAAISAAAAAACGPGWAAIDVAAQPSDGALLAVAARLCQD